MTDIPAEAWELLGVSERAVLSIFEDIAIAGEEMDKAKIPVGDPADCFLSLQRPEMLRNRPAWVYRSHVQELIRRAQGGFPLEPGTMAEVLICMQETSLLAPLNPEGRHRTWQAFQAVAPEMAAQIWPEGEEPQELYSGHGAEELSQLRRKLARKRRIT